MTPEESEELMRQSALIGASGQAAQQSAAAQYYVQEQDKNLAETQLEVDTILAEAYHLLKQDVYGDMGDGKFGWTVIKDTKQRVLTDWGVERIMQVLKSYVNKNTLLSNFDDKMINRRMLEFVYSLNGLMLMKYEFLFRQPTLDECKQILKSRLKEKKDLKMFAREMGGYSIDKIAEDEIDNQLLSEIENRIESEMDKIKTEKRKQNLREYEILLVQLTQMIESTHNRAWKGEERGSIRRHTNIHELIGGSPQGKNPQSEGGMLKWLRGR